MSASTSAKTAGASGTLIQPRKVEYKTLVLRGLIILLNLGSIALLWWSLQYRLLPLQKQARDLSRTVARLSTEVDQMQGAWTTPVSAEIRDKFTEIQAHMFTGRGALEAWLGSIQQQVMPLALDAEVDLNPAAPAGATNAPPGTNASPGATAATTNAAGGPTLTRIQVIVRPSPDVETVASPFQRVLQLSQRLTHEERRADLVGLSVAGSLRSVGRASLELNLWTGEEGAPP